MRAFAAGERLLHGDVEVASVSGASDTARAQPQRVRDCILPEPAREGEPEPALEPERYAAGHRHRRRAQSSREVLQEPVAEACGFRKSQSQPLICLTADIKLGNR